MYCHNCGKEVHGNYCSNCGTKVLEEATPTANASLDWRTETDFDKLIQYPKVRAVIAKYAAQSSKKLSAEDFLEFVDLAIIPLMGLSVKKITDAVVPVYKNLGISTGKTQKRSLDLSIQEVFVKSLCALAKNGYPLESSETVSNGLVLTAKITSDMWTWGGNIVIAIEKTETACIVEIASKIKGQLYDWGKSQKLIQRYFDDITTNIIL